MRWQDIEKRVDDHIANGNWSDAIKEAKNIPHTIDPYQNMPYQNMPASAMHQVVDYLNSLPKDYSHNKNRDSFAFEATHNLPEDADNELLYKLYHLSPESHINTKKIIEHPNFKYEGRDKQLKEAQDFHHKYEMHVFPEYFATLKSYFTGKPEKIKDHRGQEGISDPHIIPSLKEHAAEIQKHILKDDNIPKKFIGANKEPHIKVYRGVNGTYGKAIRDKVEFNPNEKSVKQKTLNIPTSHATSWSLDPEMAGRFMWGRGNIDGQPDSQGVVLSQWVPVKNILHSSMHNSVAGFRSKQADESEIILGHPEGKMKVTTADMHFQPEPDFSNYKLQKRPINADSSPQNYGQLLKPIVKKSEECYLETIKCEDLQKSVKSKLLPAVTALSMLGSGISTEQGKTLSQAKANPTSVVSISKDSGMDPDLDHIKQIESSMGKNVKHKNVNYGVNAGSSAYGAYGLMPVQIIDTLNYDKALKHKHPHLAELNPIADEDKVKSYMKAYPSLESDIVKSHWNRLGKKFEGDVNRMAYAWKNGLTGAMKATDQQIKEHPYVKKFNSLKKLKSLEEKVNKSEDSSVVETNKIGTFTGIKNDKESLSDINKINYFIKNGQLKDLSNQGHFTHSSFVAGFEKDNSWLIKVDQKHRSSIKAVKEGLQSVKEAAFYEAAKSVFGLSMFTPETILGEVEFNDERKSCVAIKMYPEVYIQAVQYKKEDPSGVKNILNKYINDGTLCKLGAMFWILGDLDAHGKNMLVNGLDFKLIDHGSSFADNNMDIKNQDVFIPYFLREVNGVKDSMSDEEKLEKMPKVNNQEINTELRHWIFSLDFGKLVNIINDYKLDHAAAARLVAIRELLKKRQNSNVSELVNELWVKSWVKIEKEV